MWSSFLKMDKKIPRMNNTGDSFLRGSKNDILSFGIAVYNIVSSQFAVFSLDININALDVLAAAVFVISLAKLGDVGNCVLAFARLITKTAAASTSRALMFMSRLKTAN